MSPAESRPDLAVPRGTPLSQVSGTASAYRLPVYIACTALALVCNYLLGKDMPSDTLNYHLYAGFSALHDRFLQDYFAAGPQSYFNPYIYVPFYSLVSAGLSALEISSALAVAHSVILWLTFELAVSVCPSDDRRRHVTIGVCAVALAFVNPILMQEIGSSLSDITTGIVVLAGWLLLAQAVSATHAARVLCAGLLLGAASALKPTNAVHAIAGFAVLAMLPQALPVRIRHGLGYAASLGLGFAIVAAPWSYRLARTFGNPLFPLMNSVFRSPEFTTEPLLHYRFIPHTFVEALWRPFAMIDPVTMVHEELSAPDPRYAVLMVLLSVLFLRWLWRRLVHPPSLSARAQFTPAARALAALGCGLAVDWVLWLSGSGNSRYFLPMSSVAAVVIVALLFRQRPKVRYYILFVIFGTQAVQLLMGTQYRWNAVPWDGGPWFQIEVPRQLVIEPSLYLTLGTQSNSFIAPFLAPGAGLINVSGGYALGSEGASGARIESLIQRYTPHLRVLLPGSRLYADDDRRDPRRSDVDNVLQRFGLRVDMRDCVRITVHGLPPDVQVTLERLPPADQPLADTTDLLTCHAVPDNADHSVQIAGQRAAEVVLDRLEDACPDLFQPRRLLTEHIGDSWQRYYANTDLRAWVGQGWVKFRDVIRSDQIVFVGRESDWVKAPLRLACGRRNGHYFATVLNSKEGP